MTNFLIIFEAHMNVSLTSIKIKMIFSFKYHIAPPPTIDLFNQGLKSFILFYFIYHVDLSIYTNVFLVSILRSMPNHTPTQINVTCPLR